MADVCGENEILPIVYIFRCRRPAAEEETIAEPADSIDYRYVSAEHIPVINRMCHQAFWPTVDCKYHLIAIQNDPNVNH